MSTVPAAVDAIIAAITAALPGVQIWDGMPTGDEADQRICVGWSRTRPTTYITSTLDTGDGAGTETYDVPCAAISYSGDPDVKARRDAVFTLVDAAAAAVQQPGALAAVNAAAWATATSYTPEKTAAGVQALAEFVIHVEALTP